jgi:hypothetical protein
VHIFPYFAKFIIASLNGVLFACLIAKLVDPGAVNVFCFGNCWASPGDLISQPPGRQPSDRLYWTIRSASTECSEKIPSGSKNIARFCYIVAKNGSVTKSNKKAELAGDLAGDLAGELVAIFLN